VIAVELDPVWAARLRGRWPNVDLVEGDAVLTPLPREPFRVLANPPFERTTDLLHRLLDDPRTPLRRADLIVEWGVAMKRALPWPSTANDVCWGAFYEASVSRYLPRTMFDPTPTVDAGVLVFRRRAVPLIPPDLAGRYRRFVGRGFRHGLASIVPARAISQLVGRQRQPRELDPHQWAELFRKQSSQP
jgi:23S rRNA (adenine-N6)-dimethyltransferase